ncbi:hypothetical protein [Novosphingobium sp. PP1Y]|uniref:hypothetical protein n=1 Tax=Novosphingobium sp. PP1Y TaxID=702113 RepID=UPI001314CA8C|nr:hypothetical protein [Novosphingobium sp. PP1Y]
MCSKLAGFEIDDKPFPAVDGKCQIPLGKAKGLAGSGDNGAELGVIFDGHFLTDREECPSAGGNRSYFFPIGKMCGCALSGIHMWQVVDVCLLSFV